MPYKGDPRAVPPPKLGLAFKSRQKGQALDGLSPVLNPMDDRSASAQPRPDTQGTLESAAARGVKEAGRWPQPAGKTGAPHGRVHLPGRPGPLTSPVGWNCEESSSAQMLKLLPDLGGS